MALKFRRGTTAQQSGSLAFGEPFVNTTLGTLLVGGDTGDITLAVAGTGSTGTFGPISGSGLDITGNANIAGNLTLGGNITIGDAGTDTIAINADLSSSLIPNNDNAFTIGTDSLRYSNIYGVNIIGSISANNGVVSGSSQIVYANISSIPSGIVSGSSQVTPLLPTGVVSGSSQLSGTIIPNLSGSFTGSYTGSFSGSFKGNIAGVADYASAIATVTTNTTTDSTLYPMFSLNAAPNSYITPTTHPSGSFYYNGVTRKVYGETFVGVIEATNGVVSGSSQVDADTITNFDSNVLAYNNSLGVVSGSSQVTLQSTTGFSAYDTALATITGSLITSASTAKTTNDSQGVSITNLNSYTSSLQAGIQMTGSTVSFLGNIVVYGTQSIINSTNLEIEDNIIYLTPTGSVDNDLGIVGHYNDGTYRHAGIFMDASDSHTWKVFNGLTDETLGTVDTAGTGFTLAPFKAGAITGTSFSGQILSTNGVVSGSSQIVGSSITTNTITIGSTSTALGGTSTTLAGLTSVSSTGFTGALTGNASTATTLQTARTINGTSFDGSANITIPNLVSGSSQITAGSTTNFATDVKTQLNSNTVVSGSSQIAFSGVTGTVSNAQLANSTISGISLGSNLAALTIGTGLSGTSYNGSTGVTIANTGVTSNVAGTGISVSGATGAVTITNSGVTSAVAGTGVSVSAGTGAVTISIGQSVATNATPTFGNLTINGTITATGDITAYYTSDKRHKNNIQTISNAVLKVKQLNGVTWEWNDDVNDVTKSTPKTGLIAQEVQAVLPQVVTERNDGFLALDYSKMVGLLVEAIKEQQIQIDQLKAQIGSK